MDQLTDRLFEDLAMMDKEAEAQRLRADRAEKERDEERGWVVAADNMIKQLRTEFNALRDSCDRALALRDSARDLSEQRMCEIIRLKALLEAVQQCDSILPDTLSDAIDEVLR